MNTSQKNITANEPESVGGGKENSGSTVKAGGGKPATPAEMAAAVKVLAEQNKALEAEIAALRAAPQTSQGSNIDALTALLVEAIKPKQAQSVGSANPDNLNRTLDYSSRTTVDGRSAFEAQQTLQMFKEEPKVPVFVPAVYKDSCGDALAVSVNGVRIAIPCDGKLYYINESHAAHFNEKMQKIAQLKSKTQPQITVIQNDVV